MVGGLGAAPPVDCVDRGSRPRPCGLAPPPLALAAALRDRPYAGIRPRRLYRGHAPDCGRRWPGARALPAAHRAAGLSCGPRHRQLGGARAHPWGEPDDPAAADASLALSPRRAGARATDRRGQLVRQATREGEGLLRAESAHLEQFREMLIRRPLSRSAILTAASWRRAPNGRPLNSIRSYSKARGSDRLGHARDRVVPGTRRAGPRRGHQGRIDWSM